MNSESSSRKGLILINTGPGKGKTTAALGTALRAVGCGMKVLCCSSSKARGTTASSTRRRPSDRTSPFVIRQMGRGFVKIGGAEADPEDVRLVQAAWEEARAAIDSGEWDLVVLDEINYAISYRCSIRQSWRRCSKTSLRWFT